MSEPTDKKPALPVPAGPVVTHTRTTSGKAARPGKPSADDSTYSAQVLGGGEKRGLKGGPETLDRAKSTYLKSEYSGPNDRRPRPGRVTKTEI